MTPALELRNVSKTYPPPTTVTALCDVDFTVQRGETVAITGASGAGKSTLLSILGTLERPSGGTVRIAGTDTSTMSDTQLSGVRAWHIGFVFQQFFLLDHLSVLENVATGLVYRGVATSIRREHATQALERVGLAGRMRHRPAQLSGGEQQRVAIARALVGRPAVLLADEPTGNLDTANGHEIVNLLATLRETDEGTTVVLITHNNDVAAAMERKIQLQDGRIVHDSGATG
ncbi:ABC transporter ATP-binding protein [Rugosimonospora africana]|uniref:Peptide ABC transporter ATP-binding protein n=1 Tax=Rugosimonospora africana TaxID=556532 RepID=A0A8J3QTU8_9ACTN|nr:ABC transporter ATP-binding protein [Rugosimonospora africana]GIH16728.1 peptide ABC transporter ATP-binding protein [Rugosimonospora africana]